MSLSLRDAGYRYAGATRPALAGISFELEPGMVLGVVGANQAGKSTLCLIAAGEADLYPRHSRTMEWDIAAGHAVLSAAGGAVLDLHGLPLRYGKPGLENPHFVARGL